MARLVGAEDVRDAAELLDAISDAALVEALGGEDLRGALDVAVHVVDVRGRLAARLVRGRDEARAGQEERAHALPVARLAGGAGDHAVERIENRVNRSHVLRVGRGRLVRLCRHGRRLRLLRVGAQA